MNGVAWQLFLARVACFAAPAPVVDPVAGEWQVTQVVIEGKDQEGMAPAAFTYSFAKGKLTILFDDTKHEFSYTVDDKARPANIELTPRVGFCVGRAWRSIFRQDGDKLVIHMPYSWQDARPKDFEPNKKSIRITLKRKPA